MMHWHVQRVGNVSACQNITHTREEMHEKSWTSVDNYIKAEHPVFVHRTVDLWSDLAGEYNEWQESLPADARVIFWLPMPTMGCVPMVKLDWAADFVTEKLTLRPYTSIAFFAQETGI